MTRRGRALAKIHLGTYLVFTALIVVLGLAALARRLIQGRVFSLRKAAAILLILPLIGIGLAIMGETGLLTEWRSRPGGGEDVAANPRPRIRISAAD